jgi:hypothetical protein
MSYSLDQRDRDDAFHRDARPILPKIAFFLGDLRDGLPMVSEQGQAALCLQKYSC